MTAVKTHDPILNLRADIQASLIALDSYVKMGGYRRAASVARELGHKLERLADAEQPNDQVRHRVIEPPPAPRSAAEFVAERFSTGARKPRRRHYEVTEMPRPELPAP
jgi:hypothetical protein